MEEEKLMCGRCKLEIDVKKDKWVNVRDFDKGTQGGEVDVHLECWKNIQKDKINKAFNEKAKQISPVLQGIIGKFGGMTQNA